MGHDENIRSIQVRNRSVELDKAWETSRTRRGIIAVLTFLVALAYMESIGVDKATYNALIPTGGYVLSTLALPPIKRWWIKRNR